MKAIRNEVNSRDFSEYKIMLFLTEQGFTNKGEDLEMTLVRVIDAKDFEKLLNVKPVYEVTIR